MKLLASQKFKNALSVERLGTGDWFASSLDLMYSQTPDSDRLLKDTALEFTSKHFKVLGKMTSFTDVCKSNGDVAEAVIKAFAQTPVLIANPATEPPKKSCPSCSLNTFTSANVKGDKGQRPHWCRLCKRAYA